MINKNKLICNDCRLNLCCSCTLVISFLSFIIYSTVVYLTLCSVKCRGCKRIPKISLQKIKKKTPKTKTTQVLKSLAKCIFMVHNLF